MKKPKTVTESATETTPGPASAESTAPPEAPAEVPPISTDAPIVEIPQPSAASDYVPSPAFAAAMQEHERWRAEAAIWDQEIRVAISFDRRIPQRATTARALFGMRDRDATATEALSRATAMARWLRAQQNAPWGWIDSETKQIAFAEARLAREMPGTPGRVAAFDAWAAAVRAFEQEIEQRVRRYLGADDHQRGRDAVAAAAPPPPPPPASAPMAVTAAPVTAAPFSVVDAVMAAMIDPGGHLAAVEVIARLRARGVRLTVGDPGGFSIAGPALGPDDYAQLAAHRVAIERILRQRAAAA